MLRSATQPVISRIDQVQPAPRTAPRATARGADSRDQEAVAGGAEAVLQAHGIAVDSKGNVYVAENRGRRIQKFKPVH